MPITEKDIRRISLILLIATLAILAFLIVKPVLLTIIGGLILAYIFLPVYRVITKVVKQRDLAAALLSILVLAIIIVPLWFLAPIMTQQIFELFQVSQNLDIENILLNLFPKSSPQFITQISLALTSAVTKISSLVLNSIIDFVVNFATVLLHLVLVAFVFYFTLRDEEKLKEFASGLFPLQKLQEKILIRQFKDVTHAIVYGQIVIGILQGILAGIGLFVFGVPNAVVLSGVAFALSIIPFIGPSLVYLPVAAYLFLTTNPVIASAFLIYNLIIVSSVDNILRARIVSRKTNLSQVIVLVGMIGGLFIFGVLGLILGPLVLVYFITFLRAYKEKRLSSLFDSEGVSV